ncbi:MAG: thermonuclease family protein [Pseudomonadota bacterium]
MRLWSYTLSLAFLVTAMPMAGQATGLPQEYPAVVTRVLDGDTVEVEFEVYRLGPRVMKVTERLRLSGVQAPEIRRADCAAEASAGAAAQAWLTAQITGQNVRVIILGPEKYGRARGDVILASGMRLSDALIAAGHAAPWDGRSASRPDFCS